MINMHNGTVVISKELTVFPGFTFEQFRRMRFYKNQDGVGVILLDGAQMIDGRNYYVSLFFREGSLYMLSLVCCDWRFSEIDEKKRESVHDQILKELGLEKYTEFCWGTVSSDYDCRGNVSSIDVVYFH